MLFGKKAPAKANDEVKERGSRDQRKSGI